MKSTSLAQRPHEYWLLLKKIFNVYSLLRERERERTSKGGAERESQNPKQAPGTELSAQRLTRGSNSQTARP